MIENRKVKRAFVLALAIGLVPLAFAGSAEAHACSFYGGADEHGGCDAHYCKPGEYHQHYHDCAWWAWCFDHGCSSSA